MVNNFIKTLGNNGENDMWESSTKIPITKDTMPYVEKIVNNTVDNEPLKLYVKYFKGSENYTVPALYIYPKNDWIDLCLFENVYLKAGEIKNLKLGVGIQLPYGYEAMIKPKDYTAERYGIIHASSGIVNYSYREDDDQLVFGAYATRDIYIKRGTIICQFRLFRNMPPIKFTQQKNESKIKNRIDASDEK